MNTLEESTCTICIIQLNYFSVFLANTPVDASSGRKFKRFQALSDKRHLIAPLSVGRRYKIILREIPQ